MQMNLSLPDVTLVMFESKDPASAIKVFNHVAGLIEFGGHIFISDRAANLQGSARFVIQELPCLLQTTHALIIHTDGFPIHPEKWQPEFLTYDYIGAPWPSGHHRMGNGVGLRSRKLCRAVEALNFDPTLTPEDEFICIQNREYLEGLGMKFAPDALAADFSLEAPIPDLPRTYDDVFMFHGRPDKGGYPTQQFMDAALK
jgi:hypothetical protein